MSVIIKMLPAFDELLASLGDGVVGVAEAVAERAAHPEIPRKIKETKGKQRRVTLTFAAPAIWLEMGTPAHIIKPKKKKALKFPGGGFAAQVHHPATAAKPFINPAVAEVMSNSTHVIASRINPKFRSKAR